MTNRTPIKGCCLRCAEPLAEAKPATESENTARREAYEAERRTYRTEKPTLTVDDLAVLEGGE